MEEVFDVCVVGAGLVGSAAAKHCSTFQGLKIVLIGPDEPTENDLENREIFGCHYDEGRITRVYDPLPESRILNRNAMSRYRDIESDSGIYFYNPSGCLFYGEEGTEMLERARDNGSLLLDVTSHLTTSYPMLRLQSDEIAFLEPSPAGRINPRRLISAQKEIARKQGCTLVSEVVERVRPVSDDKTQSQLLEVLTSSGAEFRSKKVLLCTNAFTNFKCLLPDGLNAKMEYEKSQVALLEVPTDEVERLRTMPSFIYGRLTEDGKANEYGVYSMPPMLYPDGKWYLKFGWDFPSSGNIRDLQEMKDWYLSDGLPDKERLMTDIAKRLIPGLKIASVKGMTCSTTRSPTHLPYIDMVTSNLAVAICGNGNSAKSSDELGRLAANLIANGQWVSEIPKEMFKVVWEEI